MDKITEADLLRKDIAETENLDETSKEQITYRMEFEN